MQGNVYERQEFETLIKLSKKEYLIENSEKPILELLDILFSFCYEYRIMEGELNVESANTINKTSSNLYCFFNQENTKEVLKLVMLKCITYSLIRNFDVCLKVKNIFRKN